MAQKKPVVIEGTAGEVYRLASNLQGLAASRVEGYPLSVAIDPNTLDITEHDLGGTSDSALTYNQ